MRDDGNADDRRDRRDRRQLVGPGLVEDELGALADLAGNVAGTLSAEIAELGSLVVDAFLRDARIFFCGNGGSAADAQHLAAEYVVRFRSERRPLPALALTTDTSILTAGGNDYGFDTIFARQLQAHGREGDLLFLHSTSGESENLVRAAKVARETGITTLALLARGGGRLAGVVDRALVVPTDSTARAQELHLAIGHVICEIVDREFAEDS